MQSSLHFAQFRAILIGWDSKYYEWTVTLERYNRDGERGNRLFISPYLSIVRAAREYCKMRESDDPSGKGECPPGALADSALVLFRKGPGIGKWISSRSSLQWTVTSHHRLSDSLHSGWSLARSSRRESVRNGESHWYPPRLLTGNDTCSVI